MSNRREVFMNGRVYHVFNRTIDKRRIFESRKNCALFLDTVRYYRSINATVGFAYWRRLDWDKRMNIDKQIQDNKSFMVHILAYCLMPTHYHFLLKQIRTGGVQKFISNSTNSFTRYFNTRSTRKGPLFLPRFHCVSVRSHEQLIHASRYIHLNPYSSRKVNNLTKLSGYEWSSYNDYISNTRAYLTNEEFLLGLFDFDKSKYRRFVEGNAEYQRTLEYIKHFNKR